MKKILAALVAVLMLATLTIAVSAKPASETFIKFIEAEDCALDGYAIADGTTGASGKIISCDTPNEQSFTVKFTAPADGQYTIWMKVWHTSQSDNSMLYDYDGDELVYDFDEEAGTNNMDYFMLNRWYWIEINQRGTDPLENGWSEWGEANNSCRHTPVVMNFKAGDVSMTFTAREAGHYIDQIIVTDDMDYDPSDVAGNETYVCTFCNLSHFKLEPLQDFGKSPEQFWNEKLAAEAAPAETEAAETAAPDPAAPEVTKPAPQTADITSAMLMVLAAAAVVALAAKKK